MVLSLKDVKYPNLIDIQPLKSIPSYSMDTKKVLSSDDPTAGSDGKRQRIDSFLESTMPKLFSGSPGRSPEGGGPPEDTVVAVREAQTEGMSRSTCISYVSVSVIGRRREMEDAITIVPDLVPGEFSFSAVYDGHGGYRVSYLCRDKLHKFLLDEIKKKDKEGEGRKVDWESVMGACFKKMDDEVVNCGTKEYEEEMGSSVAVVVVGKEVVVVANCGDSRVVLCRGGDSVALPCDHKPDEKERVEASGGTITNHSGSHLCGVLRTSRSIGGKYLKPYVTSDPEVTVTKRTESDQFLIIASKGLWDVVSNEVACDIVMKCFSGQIARKGSEKCNDGSEAASKLTKLAFAKGSKDNISVIVVELIKSS